MSVEEFESAIKVLPSADRKRFVGWIDDHRHELIDRREIEEAQQREVLSRLQETDTHPETLEPFEENDLERMIRDVSYATRKKAPTRRR